MIDTAPTDQRGAPAGAVAVTTDPRPPHGPIVWARARKGDHLVWHRLCGTGHTDTDLVDVQWVAWPGHAAALPEPTAEESAPCR